MELNNFLLDPNIAYLVLVLAGMLIFHALIIPGTGVVELLALFAMLIAAYQVYSVPFNGWALLILLLGMPPFVLALRRKRESALLFLAIAIALFEIGSVFLYPSERWWLPAVNPLLALVVVVLTSTYLWVIVRKAIEAGKAPPKQNIDGIIGKTGEARTDVYSEGTVYVGGEMWSATSDQPIASGAPVKVVSREGIVVKVTSLQS